MKIINLDVDDLFLMSTPKTVTTNIGDEVSVLELPLGERINASIPNIVQIGSPVEWESPSDFKPYKGSYGLKRQSTMPLIWDEQVKISTKESILFTGIYTKDCEALLSGVDLILDLQHDLEDIRIIAGGYKPTITGEKELNLVLSVPRQTHYTMIDGKATFNCTKDDLVPLKTGYKVTLDKLVSEYSNALQEI